VPAVKRAEASPNGVGGNDIFQVNDDVTHWCWEGDAPSIYGMGGGVVNPAGRIGGKGEMDGRYSLSVSAGQLLP
jgi:hypothetical protein